MEASTVEELLDYAIRREESATTLYRRLAKEVTQPEVRELFRRMAEEEDRHKKKLVAVRQRGGFRDMNKAVPLEDLGIVKWLRQPKHRPTMDLRNALVLAMKKEQKSCELYESLIAMADDEPVRRTLHTLASEEAAQKNRIEQAYEKRLYRHWRPQDNGCDRPSTVDEGALF